MWEKGGFSSYKEYEEGAKKRTRGGFKSGSAETAARFCVFRENFGGCFYLSICQISQKDDTLYGGAPAPPLVIIQGVVLCSYMINRRVAVFHNEFI